MLKYDPVFVEMVTFVSSLTSDLEPQIAEQFPNKKKYKVEIEVQANFPRYFLLENHSAICGSRSFMRVEIMARMPEGF